METLSDKGRWGELSSFCTERAYYYPEENVKEFIKKLKMEFKPCDPMIVKINELAGPKLT